MSSILASLDMSLDDLIAKKKKNTNPASRPAKSNKDKETAAGPIRSGRRRNRGRNQPYARPRGGDDEDMDMDLDDDTPANGNSRGAKKRSVVVKKQGKGGKKGSSSILSRLGGKDAASPGTKILVKNLKFDILEEEVRELFGTVGEVCKAEIVYDRSGRSKGIARVWFTRRSDADKAIKQYDGRTLDGQPMQIALDSDKNVRNGLFGTALQRDDKDVKFNVSFGGNNNRNDNDQPKGRRRRRGRGGQDGRAKDAPSSKTAEDLDNEMDTYMKDA
ncbi:polymerase delta-interacting protein 3 [Phytophthora boehmeriae]|uniref:Polymerase delta-interacting protein 3 n=1 Tax=Phytophthora boehmeriae TaxID=109152 RepID=A0A8T1WR15_9STRA|nr:polymerase delta-interacting protein 3 [Phytophthora boehmeriae]